MQKAYSTTRDSEWDLLGDPTPKTPLWLPKGGLSGALITYFTLSSEGLGIARPE